MEQVQSKMIELYEHQKKAIREMKNGCILCGGVGTGKSRTSIAYYFQQQGGIIDKDGNVLPIPQKPDDLYIITTARKRDTMEWIDELTPFLLNPGCGMYDNKVIVDSWNNIAKYRDVIGGFFIFDEQRVVGSGAWVKAFLHIVRANQWILLSATPGDKWLDYAPVFIANGFYRNITDFKRQHCIISTYSGYPKVEGYMGTKKLTYYRNQVLVMMHFNRKTVSHHEQIVAKYDKDLYRRIMKDRWNLTKNEPIVNAAELCYELRKIVNSDPSRSDEVRRIVKDKKKAIIFYNFDYELEILRNIDYGPRVELAEWNGHNHQKIPSGKHWVYLVQYAAGAEGWNCTKTDTIIFYSQNYSYKVMIQSAGRIDRLNTPYVDLWFYHIKSMANIDLAIFRALKDKKKFNESAWAKSIF